MGKTAPFIVMETDILSRGMSENKIYDRSCDRHVTKLYYQHVWRQLLSYLQRYLWQLQPFQHHLRPVDYQNHTYTSVGIHTPVWGYIHQCGDTYTSVGIHTPVWGYIHQFGDAYTSVGNTHQCGHTNAIFRYTSQQTDNFPHPLWVGRSNATLSPC